MRSKKQTVCSGLVAMVTCSLAAGCGAPDSGAATAVTASVPISAESAPTVAVPAMAALDLGDGALVTFFAQPTGGVAVIERTPKGQPQLAMPMLEKQFTALEAFRALAAAGTPEPEFLVREHQQASAQRSANSSSVQRPEQMYGLVGTETDDTDGCTATDWPTTHTALTPSYSEHTAAFHSTAGVLAITANLVGSFMKRRADVCNGASYYSYFNAYLDYRTLGGSWTSLGSWYRIRQGENLSFFSTGSTDIRVRLDAPPPADPSRPYVFGLGGAWTPSPIIGSITK